MSQIYYKHLPWTMVVHFTYTSPTNSSGELLVYMSHEPPLSMVIVCYKCETYIPARAHHCRICRRCVRGIKKQIGYDLCFMIFHVLKRKYYVLKEAYLK
jgi:ribosomal protein L40E